MPVYFDWKLRSRIPISSTLLLLKVKSWLKIKSLQFESLKQWSVSSLYRSPGCGTLPSSPLMSSLSETSLTQESTQLKNSCQNIYNTQRRTNEQTEIQMATYRALTPDAVKTSKCTSLCCDFYNDFTSAFMQVTQGYQPCSVTPTTGVSWSRMSRIRTPASMSVRSPLTLLRNCTPGL